MRKIKCLSVMTALLMSVSLALSGCNQSDNAPQDEQSGEQNSDAAQEEQPADNGRDPTAGVTEIRDMTVMELVHDMGQGINLGNTLEACGGWINPSGGVRGYETAWGSPVITEKVIQGYADCGFGVLRIPVAWSNLMEEDYTISEELIDRVKEVVDWTLDTGMYAIVNIHWDGGWWENFPTDYDECMKKYTRIWEQLSEEFKDYGDKLMFESLNEEGGWESVWNSYSNSDNGKDEAFGILNNINQQFVDIVRGSGGNNEGRHLLIAGYNTAITHTCDEHFKMPDDPMNRCAVSVHYYAPSTFCILEKDESWGKAKTTWGNEKDLEEMHELIDMMKTTYIDKGIPVIVGEYGVATGNKEYEQVENWMATVTEAMFEAGLCPVIWDAHGHFYNRMSYQFIYPEMLEKIMAARDKYA